MLPFAPHHRQYLQPVRPYIVSIVSLFGNRLVFSQATLVIFNFQVRLSLLTSRVAHQTGAYPGVFLLPLVWDASPSQGYPSP